MQQVSEISLAIGQRLEIEVGKQWLPTRLEDKSSEAELVVAWPMDSLRRPMLLEVGQPVQLSVVVHGDGAYAAACKLVALHKGSVPLATVRLEEDWQRTQRRNAVRVPVAIKPRIADVIYSEKARRPVRLGVVDISATGVHVRSKDEIRAGDLLQLAFDLDGEVNLQARVRRAVCNERVWDGGCAFEGITEALAQRIVRFIFAQQRAVLRAKRGS
jgi:c-di-GMP-binding flagellar brake protein YcgR